MAKAEIKKACLEERQARKKRITKATWQRIWKIRFWRGHAFSS